VLGSFQKSLTFANIFFLNIVKSSFW